MSPTAAPTAESGQQPEEVSWTDPGDGTLPEGITFPAADADTYEYSDQPQGPAEQWIVDHFPHLWDQGVRAVTKSYMWNPGDFVAGSGDGVGATVQYINGERFEGNEKLPLAFDYADGNPHQVTSAVRDNVKGLYAATLAGEEGDYSYTENDRGVAAYRVEIREKGSWTEVHFGTTGMGPGTVWLDKDSPREYDSWEDAWADIQENGFRPNVENSRVIYPGEVASVVVGALIKDAPVATTDSFLLDPATGEFENLTNWADRF